MTYTFFNEDGLAVGTVDACHSVAAIQIWRESFPLAPMVVYYRCETPANDWEPAYAKIAAPEY